MSEPVDCTTVDTVRAWLRDAGPGARCVYHRGNLLKDRQVSEYPGRAIVVNAIATEMHSAYRAGKVMLHLKRGRGGACDYIAVMKEREFE